MQRHNLSIPSLLGAPSWRACDHATCRPVRLQGSQQQQEPASPAAVSACRQAVVAAFAQLAGEANGELLDGLLKQVRAHVVCSPRPIAGAAHCMLSGGTEKTERSQQTANCMVYSAGEVQFLLGRMATPCGSCMD